jgi:hypothetical protein
VCAVLSRLLNPRHEYCPGVHDTSCSRWLGCHSRRTTAACYHMQAVLTLSWMTLAVLSKVRARALPRSTTAHTSHRLIHLAQMLPGYWARGGAPCTGHVIRYCARTGASWSLGTTCKPLNDVVSYSGVIWRWMRSLTPADTDQFLSRCCTLSLRFCYAVSVHFCREDSGDDWLQPV